MKPITMKHIAAVALSLTFAAPAASIVHAEDYDYFSHRDTISRGLGDANATNMVTQTIDPWPPYARNTKIMVNGKRAHIGMTRYEHNNSIQPRGLTGSSMSGAASIGQDQGGSVSK
jgi:hypothetical protein